MYLEQINLEQIKQKNIEADILRIDKTHEVVSGNKPFKLKYYLEDCKKQNKDTILTFGGAYSNHIVATAFACREAKLNSIGVIRGNFFTELSHTLKDAISYDMKLEFFSKEEFRNRKEKYTYLKEKYGDIYIIPEGGEGILGIKGSEDILKVDDCTSYTHIICAMGTGTTYIGIARASEEKQIIIGIPVLKGFDNILVSDYFKNIPENKKKYCKIFSNYHFGGYAKKTELLLNTINNFYDKTKIPTDFVYTGKMLYAFLDLLEKDFFPENSKVLLIHSGGLQGNLSIN
ncbi:MAG: 1-aminocyclopropane-1-carboxylate deaminase/D-cysteine desulfhydrase [Candidatus Sericytochromatia bacterium]